MWLVKPQVFLSYAREDGDAVSELCKRLKASGFEPWMDVHDLVAGDWRLEIDRGLRRSEYFIACLSRHTENPREVLAYEHSTALDIQRRRLEGDVYLIPLKLEECLAPPAMSEIQQLELFRKDGYERLLNALSAKPRKRVRLPRVVIAALCGLLLLITANAWYLAGTLPVDLLRSKRPGGWSHPSLIPIRVFSSAAPMLGVTFWKLTPSQPQDLAGAKDMVHEAASDTEVEYTSRRIDPDQGYQLRDQARISVEASARGYLYIIGQPMSSKGRRGAPVQIFPSGRLRSGNNRADVGQLIDVPQPGDKPEYLRILSDDPDFIGDLMTFIWSPEELDLQPDPHTKVVREDAFSSAVREWGPHTKRVHSGPQDVARTDAEKTARLGNGLLWAGDTLPQILFQTTVRAHLPLLAQIAVRARLGPVNTY